jgi:predicted lipoprotein with Yx(FWY)xxD motif
MRIPTIDIRTSWLRRSALPAVAAGALVLAGCSSSASSGGTAPGGSGTGGSTSTTVMARDISGHTGVLTNPAGRTLYVSDQENGSVLCKSSACDAIWNALTVPAGQSPTGPSQVSGKLSTIKRPDGKLQVALDGKPLYSFSFDHGSGQVNGDGQKDSFDGTSFTWQVATAAGATSAPTSTAPSTSAGGGYGYP